MAEDNKQNPEKKDSSQTVKKSNVANKEKNKNNKSSGSAMYIFLVLFLISFGLLIFTQVYQGDGKFGFSFLKNDKTNYKEIIVNLEEKINTLTIENEQLKNRIGSMQAELDQVLLPAQNWMEGTSYEVNVGTFKFFNMKWYEDNFVQMKMQKDGEFNIFTIGRFKELEKAKNFRDDIQRMGIEDAFIIKKVDGRITERIYN